MEKELFESCRSIENMFKKKMTKKQLRAENEQMFEEMQYYKQQLKIAQETIKEEQGRLTKHMGYEIALQTENDILTKSLESYENALHTANTKNDALNEVIVNLFKNKG